MTLGEQFEEVLAGARAGEEWAWRAIYNELAPVVLGYLRGQRATTPEDTTSEIFLQIVRDISRFEGTESSFRSWVFTIAHHRLIDARRAASRRPSDATPVEELDLHLPPAEAEGLALDNVTTDELRVLCETLTPDQRDVILLRFVSGLTMPEIAAALGKRTGAVKALQRRGLAALCAEMSARPYPLAGTVTLTQVT